MKRNILLIPIFIFTMLLVSCSSASTESKETDLIESNININDYNFSSEDTYVYALAIDSAWELNKDLNKNLKYVSIDTDTFKNFTKQETADLLNYISKKYNVTALDMDIEELKEAGYIKNGIFTNGIIYDITSYTTCTDSSISFRGRKRRSNIGSLGFTFESIKVENKWILIKSSVNWVS